MKAERAARTLAALLVVAPALGTTAARADEHAAQKGAAQVLFEQGREAVARGDFASACPKFAESQRLDPGIGTELWLADCYENNGQTASAWATFKEAAAAAALKRDAREKVARERVALLEPKLSKLSILVPAEAAAQGLEVRRDGVAVGNPEWGVPLPVDPGLHTVGAVAPGRADWSTTVKLDAQGTLQVTVPVLPFAPRAEAPVKAPQALYAQTPPSPPSSSDHGSTQRAVGLVTGGVGVAGLVVGGVLGLVAKSAYDSSNDNDHCLPTNQCDATGKQDRSNAFSLATGSTVAMIVGGAALAGGAVVYLTASHDATVSLTPGAGALGFTVHAVW